MQPNQPQMKYSNPYAQKAPAQYAQAAKPQVTRPLTPLGQYNKVKAQAVLGSFKKGGMVKKTGLYKVHKGEKVIPKNKVRK